MNRSSRRRSKGEYISLLTDQTTLKVMCMLRAEPMYPRRIAQLIGVKETHVSERLRRLERAGLVMGRWARVATREGYKNVKQYSLKSERLLIEFSPRGVEVVAPGMGRERQGVEMPVYAYEAPKIATFVGREMELEFLRRTSGIRVVWGMAGIGKTALVAKFASELNGVPVFWHEMSRVDSLSYLVTKVAVFLSMTGRRRLLELVNRGAGGRELVETLINELKESGALVVLDDFHRCMDNGIVELVQRMARRGIGCVIISRQRVPVQGASELMVEGLPRGDAEKLMRAIGREPSPEVIDLAHGHPLLMMINARGEAEKYIREALLESVSGEDLSMLVQLSVFRERVPLDAIRAVTGSRAGEAIRFVMDMERLGIVSEVNGEFEIHPLIRDALRSLMGSPGELHSLAGEYYYRRGRPKDMLEALYHFALGGKVERAIEVLKKHAVLIDGGYGEVLIRTVDALPRPESQALEAWLLLAKGRAMRNLSVGMGAAGEALSRAVELAEEAGDRTAEALALNELGIIRKELGDVDGAMKLYRRAKRIRGLSPSVTSRTIYNIAEAELEVGDLRNALKHIEKSVKMSLEGHDMRGYCVSRLNRGYIMFLLGELEEALDDMRDLEVKLKRLGLSSLLGYVYIDMAYIEAAVSGDLDRVIGLLGAAEDSYAASGFRTMQAFAASEKVTVKAIAGRVQEAEDDLRRLEELKAGVEDTDVLGYAELARAVMLMAKGDLEGAGALLKQCMTCIIKDWASSIRARAWMGILECMKGDHDKAVRIMDGIRAELEGHGCRALADRIGGLEMMHGGCLKAAVALLI